MKKVTTSLLILIIVTACAVAGDSDSLQPEQLDSMFHLADSLLTNRHLEEAYERFKFLERQFEGSTDSQKLLELNHNLGRLYFHLSEYDTAIIYWKKTLKIAIDLGDKNNRVLNLNYISMAYKNLGDYEKALSYTLKALDLAREIGSKSLEGQALGNIGIIYKNMGYYNKALEYYHQALDLALETGSKSEEARHSGNIGNVYRHLGDYKKALEYFLKSIKINEEIGDRAGLKTDIGNLGIVYNRLGEYDKALSSYEKGLKMDREFGDKKGEAINLGNIGIFYQGLGDLDRALSYYERGLRIVKEIEDRTSEAWFNSNMAGMYRQLKNYPRALEQYEFALDIYMQSGEISSEATTLGNIGIVYMDKENYEKALMYYEQALEINRNIGSRKSEAVNLHNIGTANFRTGNYEKALEYTRAGLQIHKDIGEGEWVRKSYEQIGNIYTRMGELDSSRIAYQRAIDSGESLREKLISSRQKTDYFRRAVTVYQSAIDLDYMLYVDSGDPSYIEEAYTYSEAYRSRAFLDQLAEAKAGLRQGLPEEISQQERTLMSRIGWLSDKITELESMQGEVDTIELSDYQEQLGSEEEALERLHSRIMMESPRYADLQYPEPVSIETVQENIPDDETALLEYTLIDSASYLWCITKNNYYVYRIKGRYEIGEAILELRSEITLPGSFSPEFVELSRKLYDWLIKPCEDVIRGVDDLIIIQDGILGYLPFELLLYRDADIESLTESGFYAKIPYLVKRFKIQYSPSATVLIQIREHPKDALFDSVMVMKDFLAFGNPRYVPTDDQTAFEGSSTVNDIAGAGLAIPEVFEPLPSTEIELMKIASLFQKGDYMLFLSTQASEANAKTRALVTNYRYVHFACHGVFDENNPQLSGLILSLYPADTLENGRLQMYEIFNMDLHADLVTLSACETGLGKIVMGEGIMGITRAFMYAGTPSVLVSLWSIADESTAEFMYQFYHNLVNENMNKAGALREAKLEMIKSERYSHPFYWA
ncbi:tetratricopeptide repeat protein, partial [bacterium]|nr:tetratricopeptide repeat protein [bacterium]